MTIRLGKTLVTLLPEFGVLLPSSGTLVIADIHLGKSATFRTRGLPVPEGDTTEDLQRIDAMIQRYAAKQLVIAGDMVHASDGLTEYTLSKIRAWLENLTIPVILTEGNHDRRSFLPELKLERVKFYQLGDIRISHEPKDLPKDSPGIAGHIHPSYTIRDTPRSSMKLKGYYLNKSHHLVLPAFSHFTGTNCIVPVRGDRFFSVTENQLHEIPLNFA